MERINFAEDIRRNCEMQIRETLQRMIITKDIAMQHYRYKAWLSPPNRRIENRYKAVSSKEGAAFF